LRVILIFLSLFVAQINLAAQNLVGLLGGIQFPGARYEILHQSQPIQRFMGIQAGVQLKVPFDVNLYFVPSIRYNLRGYDVQLEIPNGQPHPDAIENSIRLHNLETAVLLQFDLGSNPNHIFLRGGPSLETHLSGTEHYLKSNGELVKQPVSFARGEYGRYSLNLLAEVGLETRSGWFAYGFYTYGATSISNRDYAPAIKLRSFGISLGKYLNAKKIILDTRNIE